MRSLARWLRPLVVVLVFGAASCSRRESKPNETDRIGVPVPKAAVSALGAYARTARTPGNRALPSVAPLDGGVRRPSRPQVADGGVPL